MKNMGLSRPTIWSIPRTFPAARPCPRLRANDVLDAAIVVDTLEEALAGCSLVLGTSARDRRIPWPLLNPRECATTSLAQVEQGGEVALVFGREYAGLTNEELQRCHYHVHIPLGPAFGSLNSPQRSSAGVRGAHGLARGAEPADQDEQGRGHRHAQTPSR